MSNPLTLTKPLVLASGSPRRAELLSLLGIRFERDIRPINEEFPSDLSPYEVPAFLAKEKMASYLKERNQKLILTADTVVILEGQALGKPKDAADSIRMLKSLSGKQHDVVTGVCLADDAKMEVRTDIASVTFKMLTDWEIEYYVKNQPPLDKAGAYGIQDWIGLIGIRQMQGSYYTVMGLPTHIVFDLLTPYFYADEKNS